MRRTVVEGVATLCALCVLCAVLCTIRFGVASFASR